MSLLRRVAYYLGGFGIGVIRLFFFLSCKRTTCDYAIQARSLTNMRQKDRVFSDSSFEFLKSHQLDTAIVSELLVNGRALFKESNTTLDSCKQYVVQGIVSERNLKIRIANCNDTAEVIDAYFGK